MHDTAIKYAKKFHEVYLSNKNNLKILDLGALDVNGSVKDIFKDNHQYIGMDLVGGKNVDVVMDDPYKIPLDDASIDVVLSTSCFEHSEMFWLVFNEILRVLKPNGLFYLNAPSNGPYHLHPVDCYRFYPDSGNALIKWANYSGYQNSILIESFTGKKEDHFWNDYVAIFLKDKNFLNENVKRIVNVDKHIEKNIKDYDISFYNDINFYNGKVYGSKKIYNHVSKTEDQFFRQIKYTSKRTYNLYRAINKFFNFFS